MDARRAADRKARDGKKAPGSRARYFSHAGEFRRWLEAHHRVGRELLVGFHKRSSGVRSLTYEESVDEALSFGWIDGVRRSVDELRYVIRFTPRSKRSAFSAVNIARVKELLRQGRMRPSGLKAYQERKDERSAIHAYEERQGAALGPSQLARLEADEAAFKYFSARPPGYRRLAAYWVKSAKKEETRESRFRVLVASCAKGENIPPLRFARKR